MPMIALPFCFVHTLAAAAKQSPTVTRARFECARHWPTVGTTLLLPSDPIRIVIADAGALT